MGEGSSAQAAPPKSRSAPAPPPCVRHHAAIVQKRVRVGGGGGGGAPWNSGVVLGGSFLLRDVWEVGRDLIDLGVWMGGLTYTGRLPDWDCLA